MVDASSDSSRCLNTWARHGESDEANRYAARPGSGLIKFSAAQMDASGGATAGGAYLLRAKERYNARVAEGAKAYKKSTDLAALFAEKDGALDDLDAPLTIRRFCDRLDNLAVDARRH